MSPLSTCKSEGFLYKSKECTTLLAPIIFLGFSGVVTFQPYIDEAIVPYPICGYNRNGLQGDCEEDQSERDLCNRSDTCRRGILSDSRHTNPTSWKIFILNLFIYSSKTISSASKASSSLRSGLASALQCDVPNWSNHSVTQKNYVIKDTGCLPSTLYDENFLEHRPGYSKFSSNLYACQL